MALLFDSITANVKGIYDFRSRKSSYTGAAIRVKNLTTNVETDLPLGFSKAQAETLRTSGQVLSVEKIYDVYGNGFTLSRISGSPTLEFDDSNLPYIQSNNGCHFKTSVNISFSAPKIFHSVQITDTTNNNYIHDLGTNAFVTILFNAKLSIYNASQIDYAPPTFNVWKCLTSIFQSGDDATYFDGVIQTPASGSGAGDTPSNGLLSLFNYGNGTVGFRGKWRGSVFIEGAISQTEQKKIESDFVNYTYRQLKFSVSNANPQVNEVVTITDDSFGVATKVWKLNGSVITQAQINAGLTFGSNGTKTLELSGTDSNGNAVTAYSRSFYVGDLVGSINVAKGTTSQYSDSGITGAKYSIQGQIVTKLSMVGATATASSAVSGDYSADKAIDGTKVTGSDIVNKVWISNEGFPQWLKIQFPTAKTANLAIIHGLRDALTYTQEASDAENSNTYAHTNYEIQSSNDNVNWQTLKSVTGNTKSLTIDFFPTTTALYYRVYITSAINNRGRIVEAEFYNVDGSWISQSGKLYANKAETIVLKSESLFYNPITSGYIVDSNETISGTGVSSGKQKSTVALTEAGDYFEFILPSISGNNGYWVSNADSSRLVQTYQGQFYEYANERTGSIAQSCAVGNTIKYVRRADNKCDVYKNNAFLFTSNTLSSDAWYFTVFQDANASLALPTFGGNGITGYKLATKQVNVFVLVPNIVQNVKVISIVADSVTLDWDDATTSGSPIVGYQILYDTVPTFNNDPTFINHNSLLSNYTVEGLDPLTRYYFVVLAKDAGGNYSTGYSETVVADTPPLLAQTYTPNTGLAAPETIAFTDTSAGTLTETYWNFGDYITSTEENPTHTYLAPGIYKVYRNAKINNYFVGTEFEITVGGNAPDTGLVIFDEKELSRDYLSEPVGGPTFLTQVYGNPLANQQRDITRLDAVHRFKISFADVEEETNYFLNLFMTRKGQGYGFRFFPPFDNKWDNEQITLTQPNTAVYKLIRTYQFAGRYHRRRIIKPCPDLELKINGILAQFYSPYTIDYTTGIITFSDMFSLPPGGSLTVTGEYCIPVYFGSDDYMPTAYSTYNQIDGIEVVEILPAAFGID